MKQKHILLAIMLVGFAYLLSSADFGPQDSHPISAASTIVDTDDDGVSDADEIRAGTDPNSAASVFRLQSRPSKLANGWRVQWSSVPGKIYKVQWTDKLPTAAAATWVDLTTVTATGSLSTADDLTFASARFYRIALIESTSTNSPPTNVLGCVTFGVLQICADKMVSANGATTATGNIHVNGITLTADSSLTLDTAHLLVSGQGGVNVAGIGLALNGSFNIDANTGWLSVSPGTLPTLPPLQLSPQTLLAARELTINVITNTLRGVGAITNQVPQQALGPAVFQGAFSYDPASATFALDGTFAIDGISGGGKTALNLSNSIFSVEGFLTIDPGNNKSPFFLTNANFALSFETSGLPRFDARGLLSISNVLNLQMTGSVSSAGAIMLTGEGGGAVGPFTFDPFKATLIRPANTNLVELDFEGNLHHSSFTNFLMKGIVFSDGSLDISGNGNATIGGFMFDPLKLELLHSDATTNLFVLKASGTLTTDFLQPVLFSGTVRDDGSIQLDGNSGPYVLLGFDTTQTSFSLVRTSDASGGTVTLTANALTSVPNLPPIYLTGEIKSDRSASLTGTTTNRVVSIWDQSVQNALFRLSRTSAGVTKLEVTGGDLLNTAISTTTHETHGDISSDGSGSISYSYTTMSSLWGYSLNNATYRLSRSSSRVNKLELISGGMDSLGIVGTASQIDGSIASDGSGSISLTYSNYLLYGFSTSQAVFTLSKSAGGATALNVAATLSMVGIPNVALNGQINVDGSASLSGTAASNSTLWGYTASNLALRLSRSAGGIAKLEVTDGYISTDSLTGGSGSHLVGGTISSDGSGSLSLTYSSYVLYGFSTSSTVFTLSKTAGGATALNVAATLSMAGIPNVALNGQINVDGSASLSGTAASNSTLWGYSASNLSLRLSRSASGFAKLEVTDGYISTDSLTGGSGSHLVSGTISSDGSGSLSLTYSSYVLYGFSTSSTVFTLSKTAGGATALNVAATLSMVGIPNVALNGQINVDGSASLSATAADNSTFWGYSMSGLTLRLTGTAGGSGKLEVTDGLFSGNGLTGSGASHVVSGTIATDGSGAVGITYNSYQLYGFSTSRASFTMVRTSAGVVTVSAQAVMNVNGLVGIAVQGTVGVDGSAHLSATPPTLTLAGYGLSNGTLNFDRPSGSANVNASMSVSADFSLAGSNRHLSGTIDTAGNVNMTFSGSMTLGGYALSSGNLTLSTSAGMTLNGSVTVAGVPTITLSGTVSPAGVYATAQNSILQFLYGYGVQNVSYSLSGANAAAASLIASFNVNITAINAVKFSGTLAADGTAHFTSSPASISVDGYGFDNVAMNFDHTAGATTAIITLAGDLNTPNFSKRLTGAVAVSGVILMNYSGSFTLGSYALAGASLSFSSIDGLSASGTVTIPGLSPIILSGAVTPAGIYSLGQDLQTAVLYGFNAQAVNYKLSNAAGTISLTFGFALTSADLGKVRFSGTLSSSGAASASVSLSTLSLSRYGFSNPVLTFNHSVGISTATMTIAADWLVSGVLRRLNGVINTVGDVSMSYSGAFNFGNFAMSNAGLDFSSAGLVTHGDLGVSGLGTLALNGSVQPDGDYSLTETFTSQSFFGYSVSGASYTLSGTEGGKGSLAVSLKVNAPDISSITLSGSLGVDGSTTLTASPKNLTLLGYGFSSIGMTFSHGTSSKTLGSLSIGGNLNIKGFSQFLNGSIDTSGSPSLDFAGSVAAGGMALASGTLNLSSSGLIGSGSLVVTGLTTLSLSGKIDTTGAFSLSALYPSQTVFKFPVLNPVYTVSATPGGTATLALKFQVSLPDIGNAQLSGAFATDGSVNLHSDAGNFGLVGFGFTGITLDFSHAGNGGTTATLNVGGTLNVPNLPARRLTGTMSTGGTLNLGSFGILTLGGFTAGSGTIGLTNTTLSAAGSFNISTPIRTFNAGLSFSGNIPTDGAFKLAGNGSISFDGGPTDNFDMLLTPTGLELGSGGSRNLKFGNVSIPFNAFKMNSGGVTSFSGSLGRDTGWLGFAGVSGRLTGNVSTSCSTSGSISASFSGQFYWWIGFNPQSISSQEQDVSGSIGSDGHVSVNANHGGQNGFGFNLW